MRFLCPEVGHCAAHHVMSQEIGNVRTYDWFGRLLCAARSELGCRLVNVLRVDGRLGRPAKADGQ